MNGFRFGQLTLVSVAFFETAFGSVLSSASIGNCWNGATGTGTSMVQVSRTAGFRVTRLRIGHCSWGGFRSAWIFRMRSGQVERM